MSRWGEYNGQDWPDDIDDVPMPEGPPAPLYVNDQVAPVAVMAEVAAPPLPPPPRIPCGRVCLRLRGEPSCGQCGALRYDNPDGD